MNVKTTRSYAAKMTGATIAAAIAVMCGDTSVKAATLAELARPGVTALLEVPSAPTAPIIVDTTMPGWTWSGMQPSDDDGQTGRGYAGGPGSYAVYSFTGTGIDVVVMRGPTVQVDGRRHKLGSLKVSIDGHLKALKPLSQTTVEDNATAFSASGLPAGLHVLELEPDAGWIVVESLKIYKGQIPDGDPTVSPDKPKGAGSPSIPALSSPINGGFEQVNPAGTSPLGWLPYGVGFVLDSSQHHDGERSIRCDNPDGPSVHGAQFNLSLNQQYPTPIVVSGWSAAFAVDGVADLDYAVYVDVLYRDGTYLYAQNMPFDVGSHDWEKKDLAIWPAKPIQSLAIYALFRHHRGAAWFDGFDVREAGNR